MSKHRPAQDNASEDEEKELKIIHKRTAVITNDNNIDVILAGRAKKHSIDVPDEPKVHNQRMQKIIIESENEFNHLMGEVDGKKYDICGRPELALISIGYGTPPTLLARPLVVVKREEDDEDSADVANEAPAGATEVQLLYCSGRRYFSFSPKVEDRILALLKDYPAYELVIKEACTRFGSFEFSTVDLKLQRLWRRFLREFMYPQLRDAERMDLMEDRLNFEIPYTDDEVHVESDPDTSEEEDEGKNKKKRGKKKKGGKKKEVAGSEKVASEAAAVSRSTKVMNAGPSTSARVQQRMSTKRGVGLLAKRATTIK
jgi:hypothetical protein